MDIKFTNQTYHNQFCLPSIVLCQVSILEYLLESLNILCSLYNDFNLNRTNGWLHSIFNKILKSDLENISFKRKKGQTTISDIIFEIKITINLVANFFVAYYILKLQANKKNAFAILSNNGYKKGKSACHLNIFDICNNFHLNQPINFLL